MFWFIVFIIGSTLFIISLTIQLKERKRLQEIENMPKTIRKSNWLLDSIDAGKYMKAYRDRLVENDDYVLPAKELKEDFAGEKVYKYMPIELPLKLDGLDVYSYVEKDEWEKIGRLRKNADLDGVQTLYLYPNTYKYVTEDGIEKDQEDDYFGVVTTRTE